MKLTNLSIAILIALGTVACGGSDNNSGNNNPPADPPAPQPKPETPPADNSQKDSKIVDPTETHVVDGRDLSKDSTVGGLQYIRRESSDYDRVYNPDKPASATPLLGVTLDEQNPKLTNIVLARRDLEREENKAVRAQFAGSEENEPLTHDGKERERPSLQIENFKNVDILAGAFKQVGSAVFADPANRLDPVTHNIDTHIQNNTDKSGEFTRERVTHVYTPRYEYRQPFVDYPNAANSADNRKEADGDKAITTKAPAPPGFPDINALESALYGTDGSWSTEDANDNSRHPVNTGTDKDRSFGSFSNEEDRYGNFPSGRDDSPTDPANIADAKAWRNKGTRTANGTAVPQTRSPDREGNHYYSDAKTDNVVDWQGDDQNLPAYKGTITRAQAITRTGANTASYTPSPDSTYNYQQSWPNGAYPQYPKKLFAYPNVAYDEPGNNALNGGSADGDPKNHEHIYLEREDFTAIRQLEPIRPLVNPIANEWDWTLHQTWTTTYQIRADYYNYEAVEWNPDGSVKRSEWVFKGSGWLNPVSYPDAGDDKTPLTNIGNREGSPYGGQGCGTQAKRCYHDGHTSQLNSAYWHSPKNEGGGVRGEFRGPAYVGYHEDLATIRFADDRIWKPGTAGYKPEYEKKYGANLIWWSTQDSAFENHATSNGWNPRARRVDINTKASNGGQDAEGLEELIWANNTDNGTNARDRDVEIQPTGDITNGLIRVGHTARTGKMPTLGQELKWEDGSWKDHHNTTSRIFGHYHLAWADQDDRKVKAMSMNSYSGARSFVAKVKDVLPQATAQGYRADLDSAPVEYSIGAQPITLHKVQYGRVTTQLDLAAGEGPFGDGFLRAPFAKKNTNDSVDNYFFRGVDATTIEEMAALPKEGSATYNGHALMYGLNNDFHGITGDVHRNTKKDLPNAFDGGGRAKENASLGFGNFVEANVDFATRKVKGDVYNAWLVDTTKPNVVHDKLVAFEGDIIGNTVIGTADRTYAPGNDKADFRAAFFGSKAEEMGGSFNSVAHEDKYGSAYETGDWGGVFGAKKTGGSSNNTFQGDDSTNVYGNTNVAPANNYNQ